MTGALLGGATATVKVREIALMPPLEVSPLSITVTVMRATPVLKPTGVKVSLPVASGLEYVTVGLGTRAVLSLVAVTVRVCEPSPVPAPMPDRSRVWGPGFDATTTGLGIGSSVGAWLTAL